MDRALAEYRRTGKSEDLEQVVERGRRLVWHFARLYAGGPPGEDLVQAGMEGLMKAVARFEEGRGAGFVTYASHCILGEIRHYIRKEKAYYRPGCIGELQRNVEKYIEKALKERGEPPALEEIAAALNVQEEGVAQVMRAGLVSLDELDLGKVRSVRYESFKLPIEDRIALEQALKKLSDLQRKVIYLLFYRDMTQDQAAAKLGISQRKVSRVLHKSLEQLAKIMKV